MPQGVPADFFSEKGDSYRDHPEDEKTPMQPQYHYARQNALNESARSGQDRNAAEGIEIYHDYLPQLARTPDLEYGQNKPVIRLR